MINTPQSLANVSTPKERSVILLCEVRETKVEVLPNFLHLLLTSTRLSGEKNILRFAKHGRDRVCGSQKGAVLKLFRFSQ